MYLRGTKSCANCGIVGGDIDTGELQLQLIIALGCDILKSMPCLVDGAEFTCISLRCKIKKLRTFLEMASERYRVTCHGKCSWMRKAQRRTSSMIDGGNDILLDEKGRTRTPRESTSSFVQFLCVTPHEPQEKPPLSRTSVLLSHIYRYPNLIRILDILPFHSF